MERGLTAEAQRRGEEDNFQEPLRPGVPAMNATFPPMAQRRRCPHGTRASTTSPRAAGARLAARDAARVGRWSFARHLVECASVSMPLYHGARTHAFLVSGADCRSRAERLHDSHAARSARTFQIFSILPYLVSPPADLRGVIPEG